jgi:hypothetical protein
MRLHFDQLAHFANLEEELIWNGLGSLHDGV